MLLRPQLEQRYRPQEQPAEEIRQNLPYLDPQILPEPISVFNLPGHVAGNDNELPPPSLPFYKEEQIRQKINRLRLWGVQAKGKLTFPKIESLAKELIASEELSHETRVVVNNWAIYF